MSVMLRRWFKLSVGVLTLTLTLAPVAVLAQTPRTDVVLAPSEAVACLTPVQAQRGAPEYPPELLKLGETGEVTVQMQFTAGDRAPQVTVLNRQGDREFVSSVREHVAKFRVPCLGVGQQATLEQVYSFQPKGLWPVASELRDQADTARAAAIACLRHLSGAPGPAYPRRALRDNVQGVVLAELRFMAPDQPPQVTVHARPRSVALADEINEWSLGLRMPCLSGERVSLVYTYIFRFEGEVYGFKPLTLAQLLPMVKGIRTQTLQFDTSTMKCPFEVHWQYRRPGLSNLARVRGDDVPQRKPLLDWLRQIELALPDETMQVVYGDTTTITIPCLKINLNPQEKS